MATGRDVVIRLRGDISDFQAKMVAAGKSVGSVADQMTASEREAAKFRQGLTGVADTAGKMGLAAAGGLTAVTKAAMDWESAWAGVTKTVDGSPEQMAALEEELRNLARTMPATHAEIAGVAEAAGQLGVAREDITSFTKTMIDLGETTNLTAEDAATNIAQMANVMQTAPDDIDNLGAALVAVGNAGASTERQIIEMSQGISGAAAVVGLAESDVLGIANAVASMGIEVEAGGTSVSRVLTDMGKATAQGGEKLEMFAEAAGMSAQEFARSFSETPAEAFSAFISGLGDIQAAGGDVFTTLDDLGLADVRVSRALLGMAESGDLLTDSLALSGRAWDENTALAIEAAKRYDTSAAQMQVAWNNIKDAAIEFGEVALPVIAGAAEKIGGLAQAVGGLPGPVKTAATSLAGITAVFGGGLWFTAKVVNGVSEMRQNLSDLGPAGTRAAGALGKVGKAASAVGGLLAGLAIADSIAKIGDEAVPGLEAMTGKIIDLANAEAGSKLAAEFDGIGDSIDRLTDKNAAQRINDALAGAVGLGEGRALREAKADIEGIDAALVNLVNTGNQQVAETFLDQLVESGEISRRELEQMRPLLTGYGEALKGIENDAALAAEAEREHAGATGAAGGAADRAEKRIAALNERIKEQREAANETAQEFFNLGDSLDDAKTSLGGWLKDMEDQAEALRTFRRNAETAAKRGLDEGLIKSLQEAGPEGARRMRQLANATDEEIARANRAWRDGQRQIREYVDEVGDVPRSVPTKVAADISDAMRKIGKVRYEMQQLDGDVARTYVETVYTESGRRFKEFGPTGYASGGPIYGPGSGTSDSIPAWLSNGEYVIKAAAVAKYGTSLFDSLNAMRYASGGFVRAQATQTATTNHYYAQGGQVSIDYDRLAAAVRSGRQLYGDVYLQGDGSFRREMERDAINTAGGGVRF